MVVTEVGAAAILAVVVMEVRAAVIPAVVVIILVPTAATLRDQKEPLLRTTNLPPPTQVLLPQLVTSYKHRSRRNIFSNLREVSTFDRRRFIRIRIHRLILPFEMRGLL